MLRILILFLASVAGNAYAACPALQSTYGISAHAFNADVPAGPATFAAAGHVKLNPGGRGTYAIRAVVGGAEQAASGALVWWQAANCQIGLSFRNGIGEFDALLDPNRTALNAGGYLVGSVYGAKFTAVTSLWPAAMALGECSAPMIQGTAYSTRMWSFNQPTAVGDSTFYALGRATFRPARMQWGYWYSVNGNDGDPYTSGASNYSVSPDCWLSWVETAPGRMIKRTVQLRRLVSGKSIGGAGYAITVPDVGAAYASPMSMWRSGYEPE